MPGDEAVALRRLLVEELRGASDRAAVAGAQQLVLSLMRTPQGLPLPASLVVTVVDVGTPAAAARLELPVEDGDERDSARVPGGHVVRRVREVAVDSALTEPGTPSLAADYWLRREDGPHVGVLAFSTPLVALRDGVLPLFDAVVASARWHDPA
ncbi:hypothetical protein [Aquipuribacter sp. SD81]|uniref:hypothetical protein n=1 Tax=Aquipuribacter sp. SD81 TaxID=3127703 RepID=UPI0030166C9C